MVVEHHHGQALVLEVAGGLGQEAQRVGDGVAVRTGGILVVTGLLLFAILRGILLLFDGDFAGGEHALLTARREEHHAEDQGNQQREQTRHATRGRNFFLGDRGHILTSQRPQGALEKISGLFQVEVEVVSRAAAVFPARSNASPLKKPWLWRIWDWGRDVNFNSACSFGPIQENEKQKLQAGYTLKRLLQQGPRLSGLLLRRGPSR